MNLVLKEVRLRLAAFTLEVEATLTAPVVALFGPSGSGKTSFLDLIAGLRRPLSAYIRLGERVLADTRARLDEVPTRRRRIGYVPQDGALFPHLSVRQNLLYGRRDRTERDGATFEHVVEVLALAPLLGRGIGRLSGGEQQRVALGRALLSSPELLLLDEPLASLDAALKQRILRYLRRVRDEFRVPMLYVTHQPDEVVELCDEVLVLEAGRLAARGAPSSLFAASPRQRFELKRASAASTEPAARTRLDSQSRRPAVGLPDFEAR
jgi:molybdate transport system ATP-binding protein